MSSRTESSAEWLAAHLIYGREARVVGGEPVTGLPHRVMEVDGRPMIIPAKRTAHPGVLVLLEDGASWLFATHDRDSARALLERATELARDSAQSAERASSPASCVPGEPEMSSTESTRTDGLFTEEIVSRAIDELAEIKCGLLDGTGRGAWLRECERRLDNALADLTVVRDRFRKAQT